MQVIDSLIRQVGRCSAQAAGNYRITRIQKRFASDCAAECGSRVRLSATELTRYDVGKALRDQPDQSTSTRENRIVDASPLPRRIYFVHRIIGDVGVEVGVIGIADGVGLHDKQVLADGAIVEMKIWAVPVSVRGSGHRFRYSLYYGLAGERLVGYDNEPGKGDHRHLQGKETTYRFKTPEQLIADFLADVRRLRGEP